MVRRLLVKYMLAVLKVLFQKSREEKAHTNKSWGKQNINGFRGLSKGNQGLCFCGPEI